MNSLNFTYMQCGVPQDTGSILTFTGSAIILMMLSHKHLSLRFCNLGSLLNHIVPEQFRVLVFASLGITLCP